MENSVNTENPSMFPIDQVPGFESFNKLIKIMERNKKQEDENEKSFIVIRKDTLTAVLNQAMAVVKAKGIVSRLAGRHAPTNREVLTRNRAIFDYFISKISSPISLSRKEIKNLGESCGVSKEELENFFDKEFNPLEKLYENVITREIDDYIENYVQKDKYSKDYLDYMNASSELDSSEVEERLKEEETITPVNESQENQQEKQ